MELKRTHPRVLDTTEYGLETLIYDAIADDLPLLRGESTDYDREHCVDLFQSSVFLKATQRDIADALSLDAAQPHAPTVPRPNQRGDQRT